MDAKTPIVPIRVPNYFFSSLRIGTLVFFSIFYVLFLAFAPKIPDPRTPGDDPQKILIGIPMFIIAWIPVALSSTLWAELSDCLLIRRLWGMKKRPWTELTGISITTSTGSIAYLPVARFRSVNFHFGRKLVYVRARPDDQQRILRFLAEAGLNYLWGAETADK